MVKQFKTTSSWSHLKVVCSKSNLGDVDLSFAGWPVWQIASFYSSHCKSDEYRHEKQETGQWLPGKRYLGQAFQAA